MDEIIEVHFSNFIAKDCLFVYEWDELETWRKMDLLVYQGVISWGDISKHEPRNIGERMRLMNRTSKYFSLSGKHCWLIGNILMGTSLTI